MTNYSIRINKYLADKKISTRRGADELVKEKKVFINGKLAVLGSKVSEKDIVEVRGVKQKEYLYFTYNKPIGIETNSHGLLILTNDGRVTDQFLNPKYFHEKEYLVKTKEKLRSSFKTKMEAGVNIEGYVTKKCTIKILNENTFRIILTEGKKHKIRRMCANLFQEVADLKRERIMNIKLGNLKPNAVREIKGEELAIFLKSLNLTK